MKIPPLICSGVRGVPDGKYAFTDARTGAPLPVVLIIDELVNGKKKP
jgi:hypothetical protein